MTLTRHGHAIPGTLNTEKPNFVKPCGGMSGCLECMSDASVAIGWIDSTPAEPDQLFDKNEQLMMGEIPDNVNHPSHYTDGKIEVADFIADKNLNFFLGNVVKYICRAGKKDPAKLVEDLKKAQWYLNREIQRLEK